MRSRVVNLTLTGLVVVVLYVPSLLKLRSAADERASFAEKGYLGFADAFGSIIDFSFAMPGTQAALGGLVLIGLWLAARDRTLGAWTLCLIATVALFLATAVSSGLWQMLRPLTQPWYYSSWRTSYQVAFAATVFAGYALARCASGLDEVLNRFQPRFSGFLGPALVAAVLCGAGYATLLDQPVDIVRYAYESNARTKTAMQNAFDYLTQHTTPDEVILNEERDGSAWMYATSGLNPLLAVYQYTSTPQTDDRMYLATHIADFPDDARVQELVNRWGIRFVMVGDTGFIDEPPPRES